MSSARQLGDPTLLVNDSDIGVTITKFNELTEKSFLKELQKKLKAVMQVSVPIFLVMNSQSKLKSQF